MTPRVRLYRNGVLEAEGFPVDDISEHLRDPDAVVWLDVCTPTAAELAAIAAEFDLHDLAVEDAATQRQRPKVDRYPDHLYLSAYQATFDDATGALTTAEIGVFATRQALITVRHSAAFDIDSVVARWDDNPDLAKHGVPFLLWGLVDHVVDEHFAAVELLDAAIEQLEDGLFDDKVDATEMQRRSYQLRKSLVSLRRVVLPMREVVNALMRHDVHVVDDAMRPYFLDVYDHVLRASEWTESLRDLVTGILETHLTVQGNRLNEIMKKLTVYASLVAVPTAVTGFYGQNVPYPGFGTQWGFLVSIAVMAAIAGGLVYVFKRRNWL